MALKASSTGVGWVEPPRTRWRSLKVRLQTCLGVACYPPPFCKLGLKEKAAK